MMTYPDNCPKCDDLESEISKRDEIIMKHNRFFLASLEASPQLDTSEVENKCVIYEVHANKNVTPLQSMSLQLIVMCIGLVGSAISMIAMDLDYLRWFWHTQVLMLSLSIVAIIVSGFILLVKPACW